MAVVVAIVFHEPHFPPGGWKRDCTTDAKPATGVEVTVTVKVVLEVPADGETITGTATVPFITVASPWAETYA